ncbi:MAG: hypothetical protein JRN58_03655 [Nitrososphaerota archaeon]|jgi:hypothetical protein|nr:hypothetical protein [Nitrososphaerota archaeon]
MGSPLVGAAVVVLVAAGLAAGYLVATPGEPATSSSLAASSQILAPNNEMVLIRVVSSTSGGPLSNESVTAGPASSPNDITYTFGLDIVPTLDECVHEVGSGAVVQEDGSVVSNSTTTAFASCPLKHYDTNATGWVTIPDQHASYFFLFVGTTLNEHATNVKVIAMQGSLTYVTVSLPDANFTVSGKS